MASSDSLRWESLDDIRICVHGHMRFYVCVCVCRYVRLCDWLKARVYYSKANHLYRAAPSSLMALGGNIMFLEVSVMLFRKALLENNKHIQDIYAKTIKVGTHHTTLQYFDK